jgi:hypothetical protein
MSQLRFLADEDIRGAIVRAIRRLEPSLELTTINDEGLPGANDAAILQYCWQHRWLLLSHDVNTMKAEAERRIAAQQGLHGLFLIPQDFEEWQGRVVYLPL